MRLNSIEVSIAGDTMTGNAKAAILPSWLTAAGAGLRR